LLNLSNNSHIQIASGGAIEAVSNKPAKISTAAISIGAVEVWSGDDGDITTPGIINGSSLLGSQTPLPVDLKEFKAEPTEDAIVLMWVTLSELNNDYFLVSKSKDSDFYEEVAKVDGKGTTNEETEYEVEDTEPITGISYCKLQQSDFNGKTKEYSAVSVNFKSSTTFDIEMYPNPTNGKTIYLKIPTDEGEDFDILVNDLLGKEYFTDLTIINQQDRALVIIELNEELPKGIYIVNFLTKQGKFSKRLMVD
jgi:hypothetical protein